MKTIDAPLMARIADHPMFKGLAPHHIDLLAEAAMEREFAQGEVIFREGDPANRFYVILDGEVAVESPAKNRESVVLETIGADDVLGWSWLFPPYYWHFDARATKPTKAVFFYGTWIRENAERDNEFGYEMMRRVAAVMIRRLQATRKKLAETQRKI